MIIVDTTVWIDYLSGIKTPQTNWLDTEIEKQRLGLTDLILCEILQGVKNDEQSTETQRELMKFEVMAMSGIDLAVAAARNYRKLRAKGRTVRKTVDCLIATFCLTNGHTLLHNDRDFDPFEEILSLPVIHP
ncbi:MAG: PIN domain nuclease [Chloroflexi bacterium]|nr:PIN domain nuclease [Chloroflexota bacterium]